MSDWTILEAGARLNDRPGGRHPAPAPPKTPKVTKVRGKQPQQNETVVALLTVMGDARTRLADHGDLLLQRTVDWHRTGRVPPPSLVDAETEELASLLAAEERIADALASRYASEVRAIAHRLRSDLARLNQIDAIVIRSQPRQLEGKELVAAQVAGAGFCISCWRYDKTIKDRETQKDGSFYDKEACRRCRRFKNDHGIFPPLSLLEQWHARGRNWTTAMVDQALTEAGRPQSKAS